MQTAKRNGVREQQEQFIESVIHVTGLYRDDVRGLAKAYRLGDFFDRYGQRISDGKLGKQIAAAFLSLTRIPALRHDIIEEADRVARKNTRLLAKLQKWVFMHDRPERVESEPAVSPQPGDIIDKPIER